MKEQDGNKFKYVLPQGAPTSPIITNMVCGTLDRRLKGLAKRFGVKYTRYADDMTFSSMHHVYQEDGEFRKELRRIIAGQNFTLNETKTRLQKRGARQEVTGLTVCTKVNVTRKYIREIRSILYMWERYGYSVAYNKFYLFYKADKGYFKKGDPVPENVLSGKLLYLKMVKGEKDSTYLALQERFDKLCGIWVENGDSNNNDLTCLASYSITDFETMFRTEIMFEETGNHKYITKCIIDNQEKVILLGKQVASLLKNNLSGDNNGKLLSPAIKNDWFISLCQSENKRFWLIRKEKPKEVNRKPNDLSIDTLLNTWEKQGLEAAIEVFDKTNQPLPDNPATGTDKVTFISIISKHPFLSEKDKERVILLLAKELEKGEVIAGGKGEEAKSSRHNPYKVVNFLTKFTRKDCNLKYTTHSWDPNPDDKRFEFTGYDDFIEKYQSEVENLYSYNLPLYYLTQNF